MRKVLVFGTVLMSLCIFVYIEKAQELYSSISWHTSGRLIGSASTATARVISQPTMSTTPTTAAATAGPADGTAEARFNALRDRVASDPALSRKAPSALSSPLPAVAQPPKKRSSEAPQPADITIPVLDSKGDDDPRMPPLSRRGKVEEKQHLQSNEAPPPPVHLSPPPSLRSVSHDADAKRSSSLSSATTVAETYNASKEAQVIVQQPEPRQTQLKTEQSNSVASILSGGPANHSLAACDVACLFAHLKSLPSSNIKTAPTFRLRQKASSLPAIPPPSALPPPPVGTPIDRIASVFRGDSSLKSLISPSSPSTQPRISGSNLKTVKERRGIILFTHIRRAGGTVLEDYVLKPYVKATNRQAHLCKEGELARFYRMSPSQQKKMAKELHGKALLWRHCPYGVHSLLPSPDTHVYITILRQPLERMLSWFAYCHKYSPNKCHAGKDFMRRGNAGESPASRFYSARRQLYLGGKEAFDRNHGGAVSGTFHPNNLEYRLDDNYMTRMICGPTAHDSPIPLSKQHLECAMNRLEQEYAFIGVIERYKESVCVLTQMLDIPASFQRVKNDKATTGTKAKDIPPDFERKWASYAAHDSILHTAANRRLDLDLGKYPKCRN